MKTLTFLKNPHLDLTGFRIETSRCVLVSFSTDGRVDTHELTDEFCRVNRDFQVSSFLPTYEQELSWVVETEGQIARGEVFENFILDRLTGRFIGCTGLREPDGVSMNIGIWIREDEQGKGYATEAYKALIVWAREHTALPYLVHVLDPMNIASRKLAERVGGLFQLEKREGKFDVYHISLRDLEERS